MVGNLHHHRHVMLDEQDRGVGVVADAEEQGVEFGRLARVEAGGGFVEAQQDGIGAHGAGDFETALGAVRQFPGGIVGPVIEADPLQPVRRLFRRLLLGPGIGRQPQNAEHRHAGCAHQNVVLRHQQVFQRGHAGKQADVLEGAGDVRRRGHAEIGHAVEVELLAIGMRHGEQPGGRLVEAGDAVEHRGLARAIGTDEAGDVAARGGEIQVVHGGEAAKAHSQMIDAQNFVRRNLGRHQPWPSLILSMPIAFFSCRKAVGCRTETKPRGFHSMMMTMALPKISMR